MYITLTHPQFLLKTADYQTFTEDKEDKGKFEGSVMVYFLQLQISSVEIELQSVAALIDGPVIVLLIYFRVFNV